MKERQRGYDEVPLVESFVILNAAGGEGADDFERLRQDPGLAEMVGHELPSPGAARQFLYAFHEDEKIEEAKQRRLPGEIAYIPEEAPPLEVGTWRDQERVGRRGAALEILRSQCGLVPTRRDDLPQRADGVEAAGLAGRAVDGAPEALALSDPQHAGTAGASCPKTDPAAGQGDRVDCRLP